MRLLALMLGLCAGCTILFAPEDNRGAADLEADAGASADAQQAPRTGRDAAGSDAVPIPAECSGDVTESGTCRIDCSGSSDCPETVICPQDMPCEVTCGPQACLEGVLCPLTESCSIECSGNGSCSGVIACQDGPCDVTCSGENACQSANIGCFESCSCLIDCSGRGACGDALASCPPGCEASGIGPVCDPTLAGCSTCQL